MTTNTLKITFGQADDHRRDARERLERAEASDTSEAIAQDARFILNFEDFREVEQLMRTSNLTLLEIIVDDQPESIPGTNGRCEDTFLKGEACQPTTVTMATVACPLPVCVAVVRMQ